MKGLIVILLAGSAAAWQSFVRDDDSMLQIRDSNLNLMPRTNGKRPAAEALPPPAKRLKTGSPASPGHSGSSSNSEPAPSQRKPAARRRRQTSPTGPRAEVKGSVTGPARVVMTHGHRRHPPIDVQPGATLPININNYYQVGVGVQTLPYPDHRKDSLADRPRATLTGTAKDQVIAGVKTDKVAAGTTFGTGEHGDMKVIGSNDEIRIDNAVPPKNKPRVRVTAGIGGPGMVGVQAIANPRKVGVRKPALPAPED